MRKGEIIALETYNDSPGGLGKTSDLWSTLIGIADKTFVKQGTEDLKQQKEDCLVRGSFLNLWANDETSIFFLPIPSAKKG